MAVFISLGASGIPHAEAASRSVQHVEATTPTQEVLAYGHQGPASGVDAKHNTFGIFASDIGAAATGSLSFWQFSTCTSSPCNFAWTTGPVTCVQDLSANHVVVTATPSYGGVKETVVAEAIDNADPSSPANPDQVRFTIYMDGGAGGCQSPGTLSPVALASGDIQIQSGPAASPLVPEIISYGHELTGSGVDPLHDTFGIFTQGSGTTATGSFSMWQYSNCKSGPCKFQFLTSKVSCVDVVGPNHVVVTGVTTYLKVKETAVVEAIDNTDPTNPMNPDQIRFAAYSDGGAGGCAAAPSIGPPNILSGDIQVQAQPITPTPNVVDPSSTVDGASYATWSAGWWQWVQKTPVHTNGTVTHPLLTEGNVDCSIGQSGNVWYIGAGWQGQPSSPISRSCTVPANTYLFAALDYSWWDNSACNGQQPTTYTTAQLRGLAAVGTDDLTSLSATVDGQPVNDLEPPAASPYRALSPVFSYSTPSDSLINYTLCGSVGFSAQTVSGAISDGVFLMIGPLASGTHVLHFTEYYLGALADDVTYQLTVQ
jgi:hypothetical protein